MNTTPRVPREAAAPEPAKKIDFAESINQLFVAGVGRTAEVQKQSLEIAAQQGAEIIDFWKRAARSVPGAPGLPMLELAGGGLERLVEIEKAMVDLVAEQNRALAEMLKERTAAAGMVGEGAARYARQSVERAVAAQKKTLEHAAAQTEAAFEAARKQPGVNGGPLAAAADSFQRGVNAVVEAQKDLLEAAAR